MKFSLEMTLQLFMIVRRWKRKWFLALAVLFGLASLSTLRLATFQRMNLAVLNAEYIPSVPVLAAHRTNYKGKLETLVSAGMTHFELDLLVRDNPEGTAWLEVGHDETDATGVSLQEWLSWASVSDGFLWLDVKNLQPDNIDAAIRQLSWLDRSYHVRERAIIETSLRNETTRKLTNAGFKAVLYGPVSEISKAMNASEKEQQRLANKISDELITGGFEGLSFTDKNYPFINKWVSPHLPASTNYYSWGSVNMRRPFALPRLMLSKRFRDPRIKAVLYKVKF